MAIHRTIEFIDYPSSSNLSSVLHTVSLFMKLLSKYDDNLYTHSIRVSQYAYTLASEMKLSESETFDIAIGALLHDIGKIEMPIEIINKKDKLTEEEWESMKQHPILGHAMLLPFSKIFSKTVFDMVKYHHCRLDSTGYPSNISPDVLSTSVRILTIADSYDAMTNSRSYSTAKNQKEAISELIMYSNTQFDAHIASQFIEYLSSGLPLLPLPYNLR